MNIANEELTMDFGRLVELFDRDAMAAGSFLRSALPDVMALLRCLELAESGLERARFAHELKGVCANLGAQRLAAAAELVQRELDERPEAPAALEAVRAAAREFAAVVTYYSASASA